MGILFVKPAYMQLSKPDYPIPNSLINGVQYMSPGILIQATSFIEDGIAIQIHVQKRFDEIDEVICTIEKENIYMVAISCTCAWEYLEAIYIATAIKARFPHIVTIIGGWQVKNCGKYIFDDTDVFDYIVIENDDTAIRKLYGNIFLRESNNINGVFNKRDVVNYAYKKKKYIIEPFRLRYSVYPEYQKYIPFIEESRGCPNNCSFCLNSCVGDSYVNKPFNIFVKDIENLLTYYPERSEVILLASNFGVDYISTREKLKIMSNYYLKWNLEMHIDNRWEQYIDLFSSAGITKVSIGLESCSLDTLTKMNKTHSVNEYLGRAVNLLKRLHDSGIRTSVNILLHYTDTYKSLYDTVEFLVKNHSIIDRVRFNHMYFFHGLDRNSMNEDIAKYAINSEYNNKLHVTPLVPIDMKLETIIPFFDVIEKLFK